MKKTPRAGAIGLGLVLMLAIRCYGQTGFVADTYGPLTRGGLAAAAQTPGQFEAPARITSAIDNAVRVHIAGSKHPMAQATFDRGPVDPAMPMDRMMLVLGATEEQERQARTLLDTMHTQGSPNFHRWLTPDQFGQKFGPSPQDIQQVTGWLQQQGFRVNSVAKSGRWIEFSGNSAQVNAAFQTEMHNYMVDGKVHVANASEVSIPAALAPVVRGVVSLHNFYSKPGFTLSDGSHVLTPGDFATIYDLNPLYNANPTAFNGAGQTIAIVSRSNINLSDASTFRSAFGLPANPPNIVVDGADPGILPDDGIEATLDTEWSGAVAPGAQIDLVVAAGTPVSDGLLLSSAFIVEKNLAQIMTISYEECENNLGAAGNAFWQALWEQAAAQGISVFGISGDQGAAACSANTLIFPSASPAQPPAGVNGLASTQFNTNVGGTEFNETVNPNLSDSTFWSAANAANFSSVLGYIPEKVWNDSCTPNAPNTFCSNSQNFSFASGGGGISTVSGVPSWQTLPIAGLFGANFTNRVLPDVSLNAAQHDPYLVCISTPTAPGCTLSNNFLTFNMSVAGTSVSGPAFAGIMAIINQKVLNEHPSDVPGDGRQGLANYVLYPLAAASSGFAPCNSSNLIDPATRTTCAFNDITAGNNSVPDVTGFDAGPGFDLASGLGSVDANNLATQWSAAAGLFQGTSTTLTTTATTPISITHGDTVMFTVSAARAGSTGTPSGDISLIAQGGNLSSAVGLGFATVSGSNGTATANLSLNNLPGGKNYTISAIYPGDGTFAGSTSGSIAVTVNPETPTVSVTVPASIATAVAFTVSAQVSTRLATIPATGTLQFFDGTTALGSPLTLSNNQASMQVTLNSGGNHIITAHYVSDETATYTNATSAAATVNLIAPFNFSAASASQTIAAGAMATFNVTLIASNGFTGQVSLACTGAPRGSVCTASPSAAGLTATTTSVPVTVTVSNTARARVAPLPFHSWPLVFAGVLTGLLYPFRKKPARAAIVVLAMAMMVGVISCGGGASTPKSNTNATLTLTGMSGSTTSSITLNLAITH